MDLVAPLEQAVRTIPDFPKPGIQFKDITPLLGHPTLLTQAVEALRKLRLFVVGDDECRQARAAHAAAPAARRSNDSAATATVSTSSDVIKLRWLR